MTSISTLFRVHHAKSGTITQYARGAVPYLGNGFGTNPIAAYVTPLPKDKVFDFRAVVVSAFGESIVQMPPFIAYGAAGTSLTVLEPLRPMTNGQLAYVAAWLNRTMKGRFNWYYRSIPDRIACLPAPDKIPEDINFDVRRLIPNRSRDNHDPEPNVTLQQFPLSSIFRVHRAKSKGFGDHELGTVPFISNIVGTGIVGFVKPLSGEKVFKHAAVVVSALSGATVQAAPFIARGSGGSGLVVLEPLEPMRTAMLFATAAYFNRAVQWRFSWYRQISKGQIEQLGLCLPAMNGAADGASAENLVAGTPFWQFVGKSFVATPTGGK